MSRLDVNIEYIEQKTIYGLWQKSNDKTISRDINALSKQYHSVVSMPEGKVLPYFVLFRNYNGVPLLKRQNNISIQNGYPQVPLKR